MSLLSFFFKQPETVASVPGAGVCVHPRVTRDPSSNTRAYKHPAFASASGVDIMFSDMANGAGAVSAAPIGAVLERVEPLVLRLYHEIGWCDEDCDAWIWPVVVRYAEHVHLLPATEFDHHARLGGLLVYGLEVAIQATLLNRERVIDVDRRDPEFRARRSTLWHVAAACAAFLYVLGKELAEFSVARTDSDVSWKWYTCSISDWITKNGVKQYTLGWRAGRRMRRQSPFVLVIAERIIGYELIGRVNEDGSDIFEELLLGALGGTEQQDSLGRIVNEAASTSARRDRDSQRTLWQEGLGGKQPIVHLVLEAFQSLLAENVWKPNTTGSCVWVSREGVFLSWPDAFVQAQGWVRANVRRATIPDDDFAIAALLIDSQFARPRLLDDGSRSPIWWVKRPTPVGFTGLDEALGCVEMLWIPDADLLFKGRPTPEPIVLHVT